MPHRQAQLLAVLLACTFAASLACAAEPISDGPWRYTTRRPTDGWRQVEFNDGDWREGQGGFGTPATPGARVGTHWTGRRIWLRRHIELTNVPQRPALLVHHDEDAEIFINGTEAARLDGYTTGYQVIPLDVKARQALVRGSNLLAVHCRQTTGGQFIDVHLVDADDVPPLPAPKRSTTPFKSELITTWGAEVTAENVWQEYPRPQLVRDQWQNLNGHWDYAITSLDDARPATWDGHILVPFCLESKLSGVRRLLDPTEALWYRRAIDVQRRADARVLLHFEAVDYRCRAWVNDQEVGRHVGGNNPFYFDVTDALRDGKNQLIVRVEDATGGAQLRGKQRLDPQGIWYTRVSGIWQTVWLEQAPRRRIDKLKLKTDAQTGEITVRAVLAGEPTDREQLRVVVLDGDRPVARSGVEGDRLTVSIDDPQLWSPTDPHLYDLRVSLLDANGNPIDEVRSYCGIRSLGRTRDADGHLRFTLNGNVIFHWGTLDQGWWPDGLLTPPSDEAMRYDVEFLKSAGFNMIRKHIKVEPRRYYYHCDRLGVMLWQDHVSGGVNPPWTRLQPNPEDATWNDADHEQFMMELEEMVDTLENHPSIVVWVPFNEAWGQHRTMEVGRWMVDRDPTRLVNIASGGNFWPVGHVVDAHSYPHPEFPFQGDRFHDFIKVMGEFGGHGWPVRGHLFDNSRRNWGYGGLPRTIEQFQDRYRESLRLLAELKAKGIAAGVYTQTTDVEGEINGLMTYDRKAPKVAAEELRQMHEALRD